ncbi:MAG: hypothetical protein ACOYKR_06765 [Sphingobacterium thalpophilum]
MEKYDLKSIGCKPLLAIELENINGGDTPGVNTSFANDVAYYLTYAFFGAVDMIRAFGAGAAKGQKLRFQG